MPRSIAGPSVSFRPLPQELRSAFDTVPVEVRAYWHDLRALILETADRTEGAGAISESLKWGEPSFRAPGGTPVRLGWKASTPDVVRLLVHCQTDLVSRWRERYGDTFTFEGTRAIALPLDQKLPRAELAHCIAMALTHKRR